jgi:hypothetical protein
MSRTAETLDRDTAAQRLYDAECAWHAARQTGVDEWIARAADRLHEAVEQYLRQAASTPTVDR